MKPLPRSLVVMWLTLVAADLSHSFDIAIYKDPLSYRYEWLLTNCRKGFDVDRETDSTVIFSEPWYNPDMMDSVYNWYKEMGVNYVMVIYPYDADFIQIPVDTGMHIKVMNWYLPGTPGMQGSKYADAQYRDVFPGVLWPNENGYWSLPTSIGENAERLASGPPNFDISNRRPVVTIGPESADWLWLPTSELGYFSG